MNPWLPSMPAAAIDSMSLTTFLRQGYAESNTHEYKLEGDTKRLAEVLSGLANTYGGIAIVGVPDKWTGDLTTLGHVDDKAETRVVDRLVDSLDPSSWLPTFIPVEVEDHRLLVLKVDLALAPRPLLALGRAYLKRERRTVPASWLDLRSLFAEQRLPAPAAPALLNRSLNSTNDGSSLIGEVEPPDLVFRLVAGCAAWPSELRGRRADARLRDMILDYLRSGPIDSWVKSYAGNHDLAAPAEWKEAPPSNAGTASFKLVASQRRPDREGTRAVAHIQLDVAQSPHGPSGGGVTVTANLMLWTRALAEDSSIADTGAIQQGQLGRYLPKFTVSDIGDTFDALIRTNEGVLTNATNAILDTPPAEFTGPIAWAVGDLDQIWDISRATGRRPANTPLGSHRSFDSPDSFPTTDEARARLIDNWLQALLLSTGHVPEGTIWK